ncbi:MAG: hypothetical protein KBC78_02980 [Candidatus Pacebacteria bacterium]|nr:hypothetical protein [Candidatus Paceibacterota bacterium]
MKTQHWLIALLVFFLCSTVVYAGQSVHNTNHKLDGLTQDDGITALEAGDALGFEVIPRAELEEVRGEAVPVALYYAVLYAPTLAQAMQAAIAYHFPGILVKQLWNELH